jgi:thioredoxin 1
MLDVSCPSCGETYHVSEEHVGKSLRCRRCERVFTIAAPAAAAASRQAVHAGQAAYGGAVPAGTSVSETATNGRQSTGQGAAPGSGLTKPVTVTDADFTPAVLQSPQPVVVDFWAAWCGPCRAIAPAVEQLAQEYGGRVTFAKLNADENPRTMQRYGVMGLPTLVLFKGGTEVGRLVGLQPKANIKRAIDQVA